MGVVELLLKHGAKTLVADRMLATPLHHAAEDDSGEYSRMLINATPTEIMKEVGGSMQIIIIMIIIYLLFVVSTN